MVVGTNIVDKCNAAAVDQDGMNCAAHILGCFRSKHPPCLPPTASAAMPILLIGAQPWPLRNFCRSIMANLGCLPEVQFFVDLSHTQRSAGANEINARRSQGSRWIVASVPYQPRGPLSLTRLYCWPTCTAMESRRGETASTSAPAGFQQPDQGVELQHLRHLLRGVARSSVSATSSTSTRRTTPIA